MPITYKAVPKRNMQLPDDPPKYYPQAVKRQTVDLDNLAEKIAKESTVSRADTYAVIISLVEQIDTELKNGNFVKVDKLGTFSVKVKGKPAEVAQNLTSKDIEKVSIGFRADTNLTKSMQTATFEKVE